MRNLFPQMTSINTAKLNELKELEGAHRGPGTYNLATERDKSKQLGTALKSAFGTNETRKLDNTSPGVVENPGPNQYYHPISISPKNPHKNSSTFLNNVS